MLVYCAGADSLNRSFLERGLEESEAMLMRNCQMLMRFCHEYGTPMSWRGRGGIVVLTSGAAFAGAGNLAVYCATKAFDLVFAEALWAELKPRGVDVLGLVLGETDTPALRRMKGNEDIPVRGATSSEAVVSLALKQLGRKPTVMVGMQSRLGSLVMKLMSRKAAVKLMTKASAASMGS
jgi:short-subunit dehydrogenase